MFALMVFAVASGQIGRLGQAYERGKAVGRRQVIVEITMLPALGALGGALANEYRWPVWLVIAAGVAAGWTGFGTFRLIVALARTIGQQMSGIKLTDDKPDQPAGD
jgi:hypothetical protein